MNAVTNRATGWYRLSEFAVMTNQSLHLTMHRQARFTVQAVRYPATFVAGQGRCKPAAIQENQHLIAIVEVGLNGIDQLSGIAPDRFAFRMSTGCQRGCRAIPGRQDRTSRV